MAGLAPLDVLEVHGCLRLEKFHRHVGGAGRKGREDSSEVSTVGTSSEGKGDGYSVPAASCKLEPRACGSESSGTTSQLGGIEQGFAQALPSV